MFDLEDDIVIIRQYEYFTYFFTIFILLWLHMPWISIWYILIGYSIAFTDEDVREMHEHDIEKFMTLHQELYTMAEREGLELTEASIIELLDNVQENVVLPISYRIADSYINNIVRAIRSDRIKKFDAAKWTLSPTKLFKRDFSKHKLIITSEFNIKFSKAFWQYDLVRYKTIGLVVNNYLENSYILQGIYSTQEFHLDLFKAYNRFICLRFTDYVTLCKGVESEKSNKLVSISTEKKREDISDYEIKL